MNLDDYIKYLLEFDIKYKFLAGRGSLDFNLKKLDINPLYNEDGLISSYYFMKHHYENVINIYATHAFIHDHSIYFYEENKDLIDKFIYIELHPFKFR